MTQCASWHSNMRIQHRIHSVLARYLNLIMRKQTNSNWGTVYKTICLYFLKKVRKLSNCFRLKETRDVTCECNAWFGLDAGWREEFSVEDIMGATVESLVRLLCNPWLSQLDFLNLITKLRLYKGMRRITSLFSHACLQGLRGSDLCNQFSDVSGKTEIKQVWYDLGDGYRLYFSCSSVLRLKLFQNRKASKPSTQCFFPHLEKNSLVFSMANFSTGKQSASQVLSKAFILQYL